jgi:hypothetical protein
VEEKSRREVSDYPIRQPREEAFSTSTLGRQRAKKVSKRVQGKKQE